VKARCDDDRRGGADEKREGSCDDIGVKREDMKHKYLKV
jgi:hypothetical protein